MRTYTDANEHLGHKNERPLAHATRIRRGGRMIRKTVICAGLAAIATVPALAAGDQNPQPLRMNAPLLTRDAARHGWPYAPKARHKRAVSRSAAIALRRQTGCRVTMVRSRPLVGYSAGHWRIRTNARGPAVCRHYRVIVTRFWEDGSGTGWPTPPRTNPHLIDRD